jgi:hypothetical protein
MGAWLFGIRCGWMLRANAEENLEAVINVSERFFVGVARVSCIALGVLLAEVGHIPSVHCRLGMVGSSQRFFSPDGIDPFVHGILVGDAQLVKIFRAHRDGSLNKMAFAVNR